MMLARVLPLAGRTTTGTAVSFRRCASRSSSYIPFYGSPRPSALAGTTLLDRMGLALQSATTAFSDPTRGDAVAVLGEVTGVVALQRIRERMLADETGSLILSERPIVSKETVDMEKLIHSSTSSTAQDSITFGQAYQRFLSQHAFDPDDRSPVLHLKEDLAYIMLRYRQSHDYWHTLTDLPPTILGELGLKYLELLQMKMPVAALSVAVGVLKLSAKEREILHELYLPWAIRQSQKAQYLMNVYYEHEFDTPLLELRERLQLEPAPAQEELV